MEVLENRIAIVVKPLAASHGFQEKFVQKFVQSVAAADPLGALLRTRG